MKTTHKGYTVCAEARKHGTDEWTVVVSVFNDDDEVVVGPLNLDHEITFATEALAERAGLLVAKYWVDGVAAEPEPAV